MHKLSDMINLVKINKKRRIVVAAAHDLHVLESIKLASEKDFIDAILIGNETLILKYLNQLNMNPHDYQIISELDDQLACQKAVKLIKDDQADILMKGLVETSVILKEVLHKTYGLKSNRRLSHVSVLEVNTYHKLLFMTDGAMNMYPDLELKKEIIENAIDMTHKLGITKPNVGCIAAIEKVNPKMAATIDCEALTQIKFNGANVGGPFAIDNAINKEAAIHKGISDPMCGDVDILLMPQIEAGNVFYKSMVFLAHAKSASVILGATHPIIITSRADSSETKFNSILLASLLVN